MVEFSWPAAVFKQHIRLRESSRSFPLHLPCRAQLFSRLRAVVTSIQVISSCSSPAEKYLRLCRINCDGANRSVTFAVGKCKPSVISRPMPMARFNGRAKLKGTHCMRPQIPSSTATLPDRNSINRSRLQRGFHFVPLAFALAWLSLSPTAEAVDPPPDGGYPGNNR